MPPDSPATTSGDAVEEPKPIVPVFVVANAVRAIDSAIQDVIDASRNLNAETARQGVIPEPDRPTPCALKLRLTFRF